MLILVYFLAFAFVLREGIGVRSDLRELRRARRERRAIDRLGRLGLAPPALPPAPPPRLPQSLYVFPEEIFVVRFHTQHRLVQLRDAADNVTCTNDGCGARFRAAELHAVRYDPTPEMEWCEPVIRALSKSGRSRPPPTSIPGGGIPRLG